MSRETVDKIFDAIINENLEDIWNIAEMNQPFDEDYMEENLDIVFKKIMQKIEKEDFDYFLTEKNKSDIFIKLLTYSSRVDVIKEYIEKRKELDLTSSEIVDLILATKDKNYIRQCVEKIDKEFNLESFFIAELIGSSKDKELIQKYLLDSEKREKLGLYSYEVYLMISSTKDVEFIKQCVDHAKEIGGISSLYIMHLINQVNDLQYTKQCIKRRDEIGLEFDEIFKYLTGKNDINLVKQTISEYKDLKLNSLELVKLIAFTEDGNYIKHIIENCKDMNINSYGITTLILKTNDIKYIKECIAKRDDFQLKSVHILKMILATRDSEYIKKCVEIYEDLELDSQAVLKLIIESNDKEYAKKCIEQHEKYGLHSGDIIKIATEIHDTQYIKECIIRKDEFGLDSYDIAKIVVMMDDKEFIRECLNDANLNLDDMNKKAFNMAVNTQEAIKELHSKAKIKLPTNMTIGMEIECLGSMSSTFKEKGEAFFDDWTRKNDGSLTPDGATEDGIEITSPILTGSNDKTTNEIFKASTILEEFGQYTNDSCGGHVHIGSNYLTSVQAWHNMLELWSNTESLLYVISNEKGTIPRKGIADYAEPVSGEFEKALEEGSINLKDEKDLMQFKYIVCNFQKNKYKGINFRNLFGMTTIEFRLANGTVNPEVWIENINLFGGLLKASQELSIIQAKNYNERTDEEKSYLECFESIRNGNLMEKEKLEKLLELVIEESDRNIYRERYDVNIELIKKHPVLQNSIKGKLAKKNFKVIKDNDEPEKNNIGEER